MTFCGCVCCPEREVETGDAQEHFAAHGAEAAVQRGAQEQGMGWQVSQNSRRRIL